MMKDEEIIRTFYKDLERHEPCARRRRGDCACTPLPDSPRCYFTRIAVRGRRVIYAWDPSKRWPHNTFAIDTELIEGFTFDDKEAARRFDMGSGRWHDTFDTWERAEEWLRTVDEEAPPWHEG